MPGYTPLVVLPRYTALSGPSDFKTSAVRVSDYSNAIVNVWHGIATGPAGACYFTCQESTDAEAWTTCAGTTEDYDPGDETEGQMVAQLNKRWFRLQVKVQGTDVTVTCWAVGSLESR